MERDAPLLIYRNSESRYTATGRVGPIAHTEHVGGEYWDGGPALDVSPQKRAYLFKSKFYSD